MEVRKRRKPMAEINVVPYIDVMLVLLVIFMITAPLITAGVKVELPSADGKPLPANAETPLIATVDAEGRYYLSVGAENSSPMTLSELITLIRAHKQVTPAADVFVNGDTGVPYGNVVRLFAALKKAGVDEVNLMVSPEETR